MDKAEIRALVEKVLARRGLLASPEPSGQLPHGVGQPPPPPVLPARASGAAASPAPVPPENIPLEISARHVHLTKEAVAELFGSPSVLKAARGLSQPGEFLSEQRVKLIGPRGELDNVAILGPERKAVQAELSMTDARILGIEAPLRLSGDLSGAGEIKIQGPLGSIRAKAAIIAKIHFHLRSCDAENLGLRNGASVRVRIKSRRPLVFEDVPVRVREDFMPALHIDFDEANACMFKPGDSFEILSDERPPGVCCDSRIKSPKIADQAIANLCSIYPANSHRTSGSCSPENRDFCVINDEKIYKRNGLLDSRAESGPVHKPGKAALVTESDARRLVKAEGKIRLERGTIVTPAAKDVFFAARRRIEWES
ncbi:MAG: phosphate propanoyltransferase [Treponema sp.]|jgi:propanediol utilization protein|nr:phosphate propanoyltransferase [Treponema sp.]